MNEKSIGKHLELKARVRSREYEREIPSIGNGRT